MVINASPSVAIFISCGKNLRLLKEFISSGVSLRLRYCQPQTVLKQKIDGFHFRHVTGHNSRQREQTFEHVYLFLHNRPETLVGGNCYDAGSIGIRRSGYLTAGRQRPEPALLSDRKREVIDPPFS